MNNNVARVVSFLLLVEFISATWAACVWLVASITNACLRVRWQVTGVAFGIAFVVTLFWLSLCQISGRESDAEERRGGTEP